jgi:DNA-binding MarR family transcriptional regulator
LAQLEESGYVTRTRSQQDNRVVIVALTASGKRIVERPLGWYPLLRRRLETLPEERLLLINAALVEFTHLLGVREDE